MLHLDARQFIRLVQKTLEHLALLLLGRYGFYDSRNIIKGVPTKMAVGCAVALVVMYTIEDHVTDESTMILVPVTIGLIAYLYLRLAPMAFGCGSVARTD